MSLRFSILMGLMVFLILTEPLSQGADLCEWAQHHYGDKLLDKAIYGDVSKEIEAVESKCTLPPSEQLSEKTKSEIKNRGYISEADYILKQAEVASTYRDVKADFEQYQNFMKLAGVDPISSNVSNHWQELLKEGASNQKTAAKDCQPKNFSDKFGENRDQDRVGWCYAFALADFIGFKAGFRVSAADIENSDFAHMNPGFKNRDASHLAFEGGFIPFAYRAARGAGLCRESDFPSEFLAENVDLKAFVEWIEGFSKKKTQTGMSSEELFTEVNQCFSKSMSKSQIQILADALMNALPQTAFYEYAQKSCEKKRVMFDLPALAEPERPGPVNMIQFMNKKLDRGLPVLIGWYPLLSSGDRRALNRRGDGHASLVVGRRYNHENGKCEYLIRNSWGKSCDYYSSEYECHDGNVWLPREYVHKMVVEAYSYEH